MQDIFNTINWDELPIANPKATHLPDLIRNFHTTESEEEFDELFKQFSEFVHPMGLITTTTIPATRILIQLLKDTDDIHRKQAYILRLHYILVSTLKYPNRRRYKISRIRFDSPDYPTQFRNELAVYDLVHTNHVMFIEQLSSENPALVIPSIAILSTLQDKDESFISALLACIKESNNTWVKSISVWAFAKENYRQYKTDTWQDYDKILLNWVENGDSFIFRVSAALGRLLVHYRVSGHSPLPSVVTDTLAEYISTDTWDTLPTNLKKLEHLIHYQLPLTHFNVMRIFYKDARLYFEILLEILECSHLSSTKAHTHYRELLDSAFRKTNWNESVYYWETHVYIDSSNTPDQLIYEYVKNLKRGQYHPDTPLNDRQKQVLQAIVDCEPFWEIPTNLFSYFYGLPDDREALRKLANQG